MFDEGKLVTWSNDLKKQGNNIIMTNGCFDVYIDSYRLFKKTALLGDKLILAINSDESIKRLKGKKKT